MNQNKKAQTENAGLNSQILNTPMDIFDPWQSVLHVLDLYQFINYLEC